VPSVVRHNLQCQLEKEWTPERNTIGHTHACFKQTGVGSNGILECKFLSENAHRTRCCRSAVRAHQCLNRIQA
jgi:hypothetical protein